MKSFLKENKYFIFLLIFIVLLTWYKILSRYPTGEGYYYFIEQNRLNPQSLNFHSVFTDYDFFVKVIFFILIPIFRDNISLYMYFQFGLMIITYIIFYLVLVKLFKDKWLAFTSTIFFIANYVGQYTMMGQGDYQRFIQRVPELSLIFLAFLFLVYFLRDLKLKNILLSFFFYLIALIGFHFTSFFLPLFVLIPFFYCLVYLKFNIKRLSPVVAYIVVTMLVIKSDTLSRPNYSMLKFVSNTPHLLQMILYQVFVTGFPVQFTQFLSKHAKSVVVNPYMPMMLPILLIILVYIYFGFLKIRRNKEVLSIYLTLIVSLFFVSFLNMYAYNAETTALFSFGEDRIYFIHSIIFAIIWGIIVAGFFSGLKKNIYRGACVAIVLLFLFQNVTTIWTEMDNIVVHSQIIKSYLQTIKQLSPKFDKHTVLASPWEPLTASAIISTFYKVSPDNIVTFDSNWESQVARITSDRNNVYVIDFDYSVNASGVYDPNTVKIINLTDNFRKYEKIPKSKHE